MAAPINELKQKRIDTQATLTAQRAARVAAAEVYAELLESSTATPEARAEAKRKARSFDAAIANGEDLVATLDQQVHNMQLGLNREKARVGRGADVRDDDLPATSGLPPVPARTIATIEGMYPQVGFHASESRRESLRETLLAVFSGQSLLPSVLAASASEGIVGDGGAFLTPEVSGGVWRRVPPLSVMMSIGIRTEIMNTDERYIYAVDDSSELGNASGGITAGWVGENEEATAQILKTRRMLFKTKKLLVLLSMSNELGDDAPDYLPEAEISIAVAIAQQIDYQLIFGTGAGTLLGCLNSAACITVTKEGSQSADTITWTNVTTMISRLAPGSFERSYFLVHPTTLPQLLSMSLTIGAGGTQPRGVFESGGSTGWQLLGRPVVVTSRVPPLGERGDILLLDPTQLCLCIRKGIAIERSSHVYFSSDRLAIRGKWRGDGQPLWDKPLTLVDGSTCSPIVVLEAR